MRLSEADIQPDLDRRRPGTSKFVTQRNEPDAVQIISGVYEGLTTGTPICLLIQNTDQRSKDYGNILQTFRPGHADYTYWRKYGVRDPRGGGRSSARLTAPMVAAGAVAKKWLKEHHGTTLVGDHIALANIVASGIAVGPPPHKILPLELPPRPMQRNQSGNPLWTSDRPGRYPLMVPCGRRMQIIS